MRFFRTHFVNKIFALFLGVAFLNMSFFLTEIRMLDLELDRNLIENIAQMIFNVGMEEERDLLGDTPEENGKSKTAVDFHIFSGRSSMTVFYLIHENGKANRDVNAPPPGYSDVITPPPKV